MQKKSEQFFMHKNIIWVIQYLREIKMFLNWIILTYHIIVLYNYL